MNSLDIEKNLAEHLGKRIPAGRYSSFDYCFNYFQFHREEERLDDLLSGEALQLSCLHLGFYLASWGMLRGSTELLQRSVRTFVPVVELLVYAPAELWTLDADGYGESEIAKIRSFAKTLRPTLHDGASDLLVTKVMLGTMSCVRRSTRTSIRVFAARRPGRRRSTGSVSSMRTTRTSSTRTASEPWTLIAASRPIVDTPGQGDRHDLLRRGRGLI